MSEVKQRVLSETFKSLLTQMDSLSTEELLELQSARGGTEGACSQAFRHVMLALEDMARAELINRDLIRGVGV